GEARAADRARDSHFDGAGPLGHRRWHHDHEAVEDHGTAGESGRQLAGEPGSEQDRRRRLEVALAEHDAIAVGVEATPVTALLRRSHVLEVEHRARRGRHVDANRPRPATGGKRERTGKQDAGAPCRGSLAGANHAADSATWIARSAIRSRVFAAYSAMWGARACALSASMLSHFSTTTKVSGPKFFWYLPRASTSTRGVYSI